MAWERNANDCINNQIAECSKEKFVHVIRIGQQDQSGMAVRHDTMIFAKLIADKLL